MSEQNLVLLLNCIWFWGRFEYFLRLQYWNNSATFTLAPKDGAFAVLSDLFSYLFLEMEGVTSIPIAVNSLQEVQTSSSQSLVAETYCWVSLLQTLPSKSVLLWLALKLNSFSISFSMKHSLKKNTWVGAGATVLEQRDWGFFFFQGVL